MLSVCIIIKFKFCLNFNLKNYTVEAVRFGRRMSMGPGKEEYFHNKITQISWLKTINYHPVESHLHLHW